MSAKNKRKKNGAGLVGDLEDFPLSGLLIWLHFGGYDTVLRIGSGVLRGTLYLRNGKLFRCEFGECAGELALGSMLTLERGAFSTSALPNECPLANVDGSTEELVLRWAVKRDPRNHQLAAA